MHCNSWSIFKISFSTVKDFLRAYKVILMQGKLKFCPYIIKIFTILHGDDKSWIRDSRRITVINIFMKILSKPKALPLSDQLSPIQNPWTCFTLLFHYTMWDSSTDSQVVLHLEMPRINIRYEHEGHNSQTPIAYRQSSLIDQRAWDFSFLCVCVWRCLSSSSGL